jgi:hypothetical protein
MKLELQKVKNVVDKMGEEFDSHNFITRYLNEYEKEYIQILADSEVFRTANAQIGRFLSDHSVELGIEKVERVVSSNIKGNESENQNWVKRCQSKKNQYGKIDEG